MVWPLPTAMWNKLHLSCDPDFTNDINIILANYERNEEPEASRVTSLYLGNLWRNSTGSHLAVT
jgi:hypothetical protein